MDDTERLYLRQQVDKLKTQQGTLANQHEQTLGAIQAFEFLLAQPELVPDPPPEITATCDGVEMERAV